MKISPWTFAVFGILIGTAVLNSLVLYFAISSSVPSMEDSPYERGIDYSREQEQFALLVREGWKVHSQGTLAREGASGSLSLDLAFPDGQLIQGAKLRASLKRYDSNRQDVFVDFEEKRPGTYEGKISVSEPGIYLMICEISLGEKRGKFREQIFLR